MMLPLHKTKIVCTIGPASDSVPVLEKLLLAGMNVARLNFSHGDFASHEQVITRLRAASQSTGRRVAIMADLPGPKIRIGELQNETLTLADGDSFTLTTEEILGDEQRASVSFSHLPQTVKPGDTLFINDGLVHLEVTEVKAPDIHCRVLVGGEIRSRKGLNFPGIDLGISAFTTHDRACLEFALTHDVDAVSQSFVGSPDDIEALRAASAELGRQPFIIAKIERAQALDRLDSILAVADGIMVARGDLGVEIPIERIALVQKQLMDKANRAGKPVITATHMLESMVKHRRPSRAEATDVANAILDGTDCVMLSAESAMGRYPVDAVNMLTKIAVVTEPAQPVEQVKQALQRHGHDGAVELIDLIALSVHYTLEQVHPVAVIAPTHSGATARSVARFRLPVWITAFSGDESTCSREHSLDRPGIGSFSLSPEQDNDFPGNQRIPYTEIEGSLLPPGEG